MTASGRHQRGFRGGQGIAVWTAWSALLLAGGCIGGARSRSEAEPKGLDSAVKELLEIEAFEKEIAAGHEADLKQYRSLPFPYASGQPHLLLGARIADDLAMPLSGLKGRVRVGMTKGQLVSRMGNPRRKVRRFTKPFLGQVWECRL